MSESGRPTVLVVEDEEPLVKIYSSWLEDDYTVRSATDGGEALDVIDEVVDVVLLDRLMPGLSGDEVLAEIEERGLDCRVAMVTAVEPDFDVVAMGFDAYLTKPIRRQDLLETVDRLLARTTYTELEREYYSLVSKRAALEARKRPEELEASEEYADLEARIEALSDEIDETLPQVTDEEGFLAILRDIEADASRAPDERDATDAEAGEDV